MKKQKLTYEVRFCSCGRVHFLDRNTLYPEPQDDQEVVFICASCGRAVRIGSDPYFDEGRAVYVTELKPGTIINATSFSPTEGKKAFNHIIYSEGKRVPMMNGEYARWYSGGRFYSEYYLPTYKLEELGSYEAVMDYVRKEEEESKTINMRAFARSLTQEELDAIKGYYNPQFDWDKAK